MFEVDDDGMTPLHGACNAGSSELAVVSVRAASPLPRSSLSISFVLFRVPLRDAALHDWGTVRLVLNEEACPDRHEL